MNNPHRIRNHIGIICTAMFVACLRRASVVALQPLVSSMHKKSISSVTSTTRLFSSYDHDDYGRRVRSRPGGDNDEDKKPRENSNINRGGGGDRKNVDDDRGSSPLRGRQTNNDSRGGGGGGWDDDNSDGWSASPSRGGQNKIDSRGGGGGGWDDDDNGGWDSNYTPRPRSSRSPSQSSGQSSSNRGRNYNNEYSPRNNNRDSDFNPRRRQQSNNRGGGRPRQQEFDNNKDPGVRAINMNALEGAGFVHLYGLSSVLNGLQADRRDVTTVQEKSVGRDDDDGEGEDWTKDREPPKPQTQFRPYLFVQERRSTTRKGQKATDAERVLALAEEKGVPVTEVDKGILNTLSGNRPHQGFVLRCGKLFFESLSRLPVPDGNDDEDAPSVWLVLDEVVDPQNLGALLRSAYFLGQERMGVLVCSKNSAPPTPVVSAASAGALELLTVHSTNNLPRTLNQARDDGFRIIGASSSVPNSSTGGDEEGPPPLYDLQNLPAAAADDRPVLLVLGSEGHGLRTLVSKACTEFVRIPSGIGTPQESSGEEGDTGVDSLNVSVTGGIVLWHLLSGGK